MKTNPQHNAEKTCPQCGARLRGRSLGGLCVLCVGKRLVNTNRDSASPANFLIGSEPQEIRIGHYELTAKLGEGGCGAVFAAEQQAPVRRRVAVKILKQDIDSKSVVARFEAERQALAILDHPSIPKVFDAGVTYQGRPFFVMELVSGSRITEFCDENRLTINARLSLFLGVCTTVQHSHSQGLVHCDLKPSNILVTMQDGSPLPKLIDFGISKVLSETFSENLSYPGVRGFFGTRAYTSPEQIETCGKQVDHRSDIYSLGVILYELLAGKTPFDRHELGQAGPEESRRIIREVEPLRPSLAVQELTSGELSVLARIRHEPPHALHSRLRGDLDWIVMKCLEKDPEQRYQSASELADDLSRSLAHEPVSAVAPRVGYRFGKFVKRNQLAVMAASAVILITSAAAVISTREAFRAQKAERTATAHYIEAQKAREDSEAVTKYLVELFRPPNPNQNGRLVTVADVLDHATKTLDIELAGQPERKALLQANLGASYTELGLYQEALTLKEKVAEYYLETRGAEDEKTLAAWEILAESYSVSERRKKSAELCEWIFKTRAKVNGLEAPKTIHALIKYAWSLRQIQTLREAVRLEEQALALSRKVNGENHRDTNEAMCELGHLYALMQRYQESLELLTKSADWCKDNLGLENSHTIDVLTMLGIAQDRAGQLAKAIPLEEQLVSLGSKVRGTNHPANLWIMDNLAGSYLRAGRTNDAVKTYEAALAQGRQLSFWKEERMKGLTKQLAQVYDNLGRKDDARTLRASLQTKPPLLGGSPTAVANN